MKSPPTDSATLIPVPPGSAPPRPVQSANASLVGVVRNPRSHRNKKHPPDDVADPAVLVASPRTKSELSEALAGFAQLGVGLLVIDGGDGTVRDVLTQGIEHFGSNWPRLAVLPKGKTNALAVDLGLPADWPLEKAIAAARIGHTTRRRPILIERSDDPKWRALGFIMGAGMFNQAIDAGQVAHRLGAFQGLAVGLSAATGMFQALFGIGQSAWRALSAMHIRTGPMAEDLPHSEHGNPAARYACGFSTLERFPLGMHPFGKPVPGIQYIVVDAPLRRVMALVPLILKGLDRPLLKRLGVHRGASDEIALDLEGSFILDGESFPAGAYTLRLGPDLHFIAP